jgi:transcription antitermination protein NusB
MLNNKISSTPRVKVIQKLYSNSLNPDVPREYNKSQFKKFIKDVVEGTIERSELIEETVKKYLADDLDLKRTDKLLKIILYSAVFELMFKHSTPTNVVLNEYVKTSEFFLEKAQIKFLNAILDKIAKNIRKSD